MRNAYDGVVIVRTNDICLVPRRVSGCGFIVL